MPMTLYFKRAKSFVHQDGDGGTKQFLAQPGPSPIPVPFWVAKTSTFAYGVKDGSIVNLTPPHEMPGYKPPTVVTPAVDEDDTPVLANGEEEEQDSVPQPPFGGQPMTPVPPAPKVGNVRASNRR